ncbi:MAG: site-2 protease family protein [Isosphaeraceae bacterium]|nr:site-2 protease family protein [Isosphaeraceae bacterium]
METLIFVVNILKVVLGLGFVIFLHELGHFLVAKWCGVYVKSFSIGFPPTIISKQVGETSYKIGLLFLGGYVSMLGEGSDTEEDPEAASNPRSFRNKSAGAKIAILSAGVVMNLVLGLGFFLITHMVGLEVPTTRIGGVVVGSPAYEAGLRAGDRIVGIDGDQEVDYLKLKMRVSLSSEGRPLAFDVARPGTAEPLRFDIQPQRGKGEAPSIGVLQSPGLQLAITEPFQAPAGMTDRESILGEFKPLDRIVAVRAVGGEGGTVKTPHELDAALFALRGAPIEVVVERANESGGATGETAEIVVPPNHFLDFGFRCAFGPVKALAGGSIAAKAGFQVGDVITAVDGKTDVDPFDLPLYCHDRAGKPVVFAVRRGESTVEITAVPDASLPWVELNQPTEPFEIPGLGLALEVSRTVAHVVPGSPAAMNGMTDGLVMKTIEVIAARQEPGEDSKPTDLAEVPAWPFVYEAVHVSPRAAVRFTFEDKKDPVTITPVPIPGRFHPYRGLRRISDLEQQPPQPFLAALKRGADDTYENVVSIYAMIRSLFSGRVSTKNLAGLPRIGEMAYQSASAGMVQLLQFLAMLSINLAVLNFMPIPPLDGGQIVLILGEKIRGKPIPPAFFNAVMLVGFALILALMLFTNGQDILLLIRGRN